MKKFLAATLLSISILAITNPTISNAQNVPGKKETTMQQKSGKPNKYRGSLNLNRALKNLNLTDAQKAKIAEIRKLYTKDKKSAKLQEIWNLSQQLEELKFSKTTNDNKAKNIIKQISEIQAGMGFDRFSEEQKIIAVLTETQKQQLNAMRNKKRQK